MEYFYSKTNQMHQCIKFILFYNNSTCFGRYFRPSSGVHDCTYSKIWLLYVHILLIQQYLFGFCMYIYC